MIWSNYSFLVGLALGASVPGVVLLIVLLDRP
jgi:hypothetical protein